MFARLTISIFFALCVFPIQAEATVYYIDGTVGRTCGVGTSTSTAFCTIDEFAEGARSPGDFAIVKRGVATTTAPTTDIIPLSDAQATSTIGVWGDLDNLWCDGGCYFATSSQTFTVAVATTTFYGTASTTGIVAGNWVYVEGDCTERAPADVTTPNRCPYIYEVAKVVNTQVHLYVPYSGQQSGSGFELRVLPNNSQWNIASGDFQLITTDDDFWEWSGLDLRGTDSAGTIRMSGSGGKISHMILHGNGTSDVTFSTGTAEDAFLSVYNVRFNNAASLVALGGGRIDIKNSLLNCAGVASSGAFTVTVTPAVYITRVSDSYIFRCTRVVQWSAPGYAEFLFRNVQQLAGVTNMVDETSSTKKTGYFYFEDYDGTIGDSRFFGFSTKLTQSDDTGYVTQSTSTLRSGGGPTALVYTPTNDTAVAYPDKILDVGIYTDTTSRQYDFYVRNATSTEYTTNPTPQQLWIECDYWAHDTAKDTSATTTRAVKTSTGTLDLTGSTDWQALSVTCQPTQTGLLYLRMFYNKQKEVSQSNQLLIDVTPVITP